jgi:hypothetical protein
MKFGNGNAALIVKSVALGSLVGTANAFVNTFTPPRSIHHGLHMSDAAIGLMDAPTLPKNMERIIKTPTPPEPIKEPEEVPSLGAILKMLPKKSFDIDTKESLFYFGVDFVACVASLGFLNAVVTSDVYHSFPLWGQALSVAPLQVLAGFAMWCMVRLRIF